MRYRLRTLLIVLALGPAVLCLLGFVVVLSTWRPPKRPVIVVVDLGGQVARQIERP